MNGKVIGLSGRPVAEGELVMGGDVVSLPSSPEVRLTVVQYHADTDEVTVGWMDATRNFHACRLPRRIVKKVVGAVE